jgi:predicted lipid-binding transport protein (Tim44 family)
MSSAVIQLLVLAGVAIFLILRLRSVLGTREGFEKPPVRVPGAPDATTRNRTDFEVIEGGPDRDITDHVAEGSAPARAVSEMKAVEPEFSLTEFLQGARSAYEMILMAFESGDLTSVKSFLAPEVHQSFSEVIKQRERDGLTIDATFVGLGEVKLADATFDSVSRTAELTVRFTGELTQVVRNADGEIVEGNPNEIIRQRDSWTFGRVMGTTDPNWQLVATGE